MSEQDFWHIVETSLEKNVTVGSIEQDEALIRILETKSIDELVGFQLRLLELRSELFSKHIHLVAEQLDYTTHPDVLNRFKNGIIASGKAFYYNAKDDTEFLNSLLKNNVEALRNCYYEGFSLVAPAAFHELTDYKESWDRALLKAKREMEIKQMKVERDKNRDIDNFLPF
ncbi:hypothetical protein FHS04_000806 [Mesoflavibacter sabulilitoris]|nr:DUF4240 domain-containing protein [Mesoflavibacter zeaxanthinifaciens]MBB3123309.1 hypothetical protein [Mesoflavibacter zeaxanthinifaciens subsp. sabulilitoris]